MTGIRSRIQDLEEKLEIIDGEPIQITVNVQYVGDKEADIMRVKHKPYGTVNAGKK